MDAAITMLDPITSSFTTMLMEAYRRPYAYRPSSSGWGDFDWIDTSVDAREALLAFERKAAEREAPTVHWLEDELFPRLSA